VQHPGVKLAPAGITVQELIDEYCGGMLPGHSLYAYLPGGASGGILPASLNQVPLDFDTLQPYGCFIGSAAVIVLSQKDRARDAALNMMKFFEHESCGQCTPCRVGTAKAVRLMQAPVWDNSTLEDLNVVMTDASICGLGQAAPSGVWLVGANGFFNPVGLIRGQLGNAGRRIGRRPGLVGITHDHRVRAQGFAHGGQVGYIAFGTKANLEFECAVTLSVFGQGHRHYFVGPDAAGIDPHPAAAAAQ
jgi:hypothetical protein